MNAATATASGVPDAGAIAARTKTPAMTAIPADRPSMLSRRLKALVMPTIQTTDSRASSAGHPVRLASGIRNTMIAAAIDCTTSLVVALNCSASSNAPRPNMSRQPTRSEASGASGAAVAVATKNASAIAQPPNVGTGSGCQRSRCGRVTNPARIASLRTIGVRTAESAKLPRRVNRTAVGTHCGGN